MSKEVNWEVDEIIMLKEDYNLSQLPYSPFCNNLLRLSIQVSGITEIPPTFFEHMPLLEELDLSTTHIQSLPSSISSLTLIHKLFIRDCPVLMELPSEIGRLTKLKLLDCEGSEIMYLPKEIGELSDLEVLRVSLSLYADSFLKTKSVNDSLKIPRNILSKLNKLKELCFTTCPEAEWWEEEVKEIQDDLCHLKCLETLKWYLPTKMVLNQFLQIKREGKKVYENLSNFTLTIGRHPQLTSCLPANLEKKFEKFEKCLKWINAEGNEKDISMIMGKVEALFLSRHWTILRLSDLDLAKLKYCLLVECNEMETLVKVDELSENFGKVGLESIEYLTIHSMEKFQCIWNGPMGKDGLSRLRILALHACPKLTMIFTINIAQNLSSLMELTVEDCPNVTSLISNESPNIAISPLIPCLEKMFLLDLPELDSTFRGKIILEKMDSLLVYNCPKLQYLSVTELPNIQKIKGEKEWWNDLKCDKSRWQNVFEQLQEERNLIKQLAEATNSLQRFHDILLRDAKEDKLLDRSSLGVSQTKGHTSKFPIGKREGLSLSQPDAKGKEPLDRSSFRVSETKGHTSNFPIGEQEGLSLSQPAAKDGKLLDRSALGVSEIKSDKSNFRLEEQEGVSLSQPGMHTPDQFSYSPSSPSPSLYSSTNSWKKSTFRRNRVKVAARSVAGVFVSCFTPAEDDTHYHSSSGYGGSDALSSTSDVSGTTDSIEGKKIGTPRGIYTTSKDSIHNREPGSANFTLVEIQNATKNFSPALKVGQGGFWTVYKGQLQDGTLIAVKRAKKSIYDKNLGREFQSEVQTLTKVEHLNLAKCYGYLHHGDERIIVVEYVSNGTLREHLECLNGNILSLASRLDIAIDVAHAITYLHTYTDHPIIHRDIKSSNILLTEKLRAKVADFGFARLAADAELGQTHVSTQIKGTAGYLDPEYLRTYQLTEKSDVYSFGILLVELVTGRRPIEAKRELNERVTAKWAMKKFADGLAISVLDPNLEKSDANGLALEKILELALQCVASHRQNRPTMRRCAEVLWNIRKDYKDLLL